MKHKRFNQVYPYVYQITEIQTGLKYFGVRWQNVRLNLVPREDIGIKYFTSTRDKEFKKKLKDNLENFEIKIVYTFDTHSEAVEYENKFNKKIIKRSDYINQQAFPAIINKPEVIAKIAEQRKGTKASTKTRKKISESLTGRPVSEKTREKIGMASRGRKHTEESKKKISEVQKGKKLKDKQKKKISISTKGLQNRLGTHQSNEAKEKIRIASTGRKHTKKSKKKISEAKKGKKPSKESRKKMSEAQKGKKHSDETKKKMSESQKKAHKRNPRKKYTKSDIIDSIKEFIKNEERKIKSRDFLDENFRKKYNLPSRDVVERNFGSVSSLLKLLETDHYKADQK